MAKKATLIPILALQNKTDELSLLSNELKQKLQQLQNAADALGEATSVPILAFRSKTDELSLLSNEFEQSLQRLQNVADALAETATAELTATKLADEKRPGGVAQS